MGASVGKPESPRNGWIPETKLEAKMVEAMRRRASGGCVMKSFNSIILKFPKIDESLRNCKAIFQQFGSSTNNPKGMKKKRIISEEEEEEEEKKSKADSPSDDCSSTLPPSHIAKSVDSDDKDESMRSPQGDQGSS